MIDAQEGLQKQDLNIFYIIEKNSKGVVLLVNKWDLIDKDQNTVKKYEDKIREQLAPFNDVPIIFTSTVTKQRIHKAIESAMTVFENRIQKIPTSKLNDVMLDVVHSTPPPSVKEVHQDQVHSAATNTCAFLCSILQFTSVHY